MKTITFFITLLLINNFLNAQDSTLIRKKKNYIGFNTGVSKHIIRDDNISYFIYKGITVPLHLNYRYNGEKNKHLVNVYIDKLCLKSKITDESSHFSHYTDNINIQVSYMFHRKIYDCNKINTSIMLGGKIQSYLNYRYHNYSNSSDAKVPSMEQNNSLGINLGFQKRYNNNNDLLLFHINIPIISYALLSENYNLSVNDDLNMVDYDKNIIWQVFKKGDFVSFNKLIEFQSELSLIKSLNKTIAIEFRYFLHYYNFKKYENLLHTEYINYKFLTGIIFKI